MDETKNIPIRLLLGFAGAAIGAAAVLYFKRRAFSLKLVEGHTGSAI